MNLMLLVMDGLTSPNWYGDNIMLYMIIIEVIATLIGSIVFIYLLNEEQRKVISFKDVLLSMSCAMVISWLFGLISWMWVN